MTSARVNLIKMCGGEARARAGFIRRLSELNLAPEAFDGALKVWNDGFIACNNLIIDALKEGTIAITFFDQEGNPWDFKAAQ